MISLDSVKRADLTVMVGEVYVKCLKELPDVEITIRDREDGNEYFVKPNPKNKRFIFIAKWGKTYSIVVRANNEVVFTDKLTISPENAPEQMKYKTIRVDPEEYCR